MSVTSSNAVLPSDIEAASLGSVDAYARIVDAYRGAVSAIALAIVGDVATSEDVAQDVFVTVWKKLGQLRSTDSVGPWIRQLTRNRARDAVRQRQRARRSTEGVAREPEPTSEQALLEAERLRVLQMAFDELDAEAREILLLYYREAEQATGEQTSIREVATFLELSEAAVKKRLSRARARLRADVLARFAEVARQTAPRGAFTATVLMAISVGSPAAAATAGIGATTAMTGGKLTKVAASLAGLGLGPVIGIASVFLGMRRTLRAARSKQERFALLHLTVVATLHIAVTAVLLPWARHAMPRLGIWLWYVFLIGGFGVLYLLWLPKIIAPRLERERLEDPGAIARHRRERFLGLTGFIAGAVMAALACWLGSAGRG